MLARIRERKDQDGFTLIELLVVMIIIGILAAIAIPIFLNQRKAAYDSATKSDLRTAATEVESWFVNNQAYPLDQAAYTTNIFPNLRPSTGVTITYTAVAGGYCLQGVNSLSGTPAHTFAYRSTGGGLQALNSTCP